MNTTEIIIAISGGLLSAIVGGFIAGFFALRAVSQQINEQRRKDAENEQRIEFGFLQAIYDEIETLWEAYSEGAGKQIDALEEGKPLLMIYPITQDYFSVYRGNTFLISRVQDNDLRKAIVGGYTRAVAILDSLRMNNDLVQKFEFWDHNFQQTKDETQKRFAMNYLQMCIEYGKQIKKSHGELKSAVSSTLRMLQKKGVLVESK